MSEHRIKHFTRRRYEHEPVWLSPIPNGPIHEDVMKAIEGAAMFVVVCEVDDIPVYRGLDDSWVHWDPEDDPTKPVGQQPLASQERY